jgi:hypothetical protein
MKVEIKVGRFGRIQRRVQKILPILQEPQTNCKLCISSRTLAGEGSKEDMRFEVIRFDTMEIVLPSGM